jgi:hypothetical protein
MSTKEAKEYWATATNDLHDVSMPVNRPTITERRQRLRHDSIPPHRQSKRDWHKTRKNKGKGNRPVKNRNFLLQLRRATGVSCSVIPSWNSPRQAEEEKKGPGVQQRSREYRQDEKRSGRRGDRQARAGDPIGCKRPPRRRRAGRPNKRQARVHGSRGDTE